MIDRTPADARRPRTEVSGGGESTISGSARSTRPYFQERGALSSRSTPGAPPSSRRGARVTSRPFSERDAGCAPAEAPLDLYPPEDRYVTGALVAGKYLLLRRLEAGGMGVVWAAHNVALDVHVALKFVRGGDSEPTSARLLREAQTAARVDHPAIVRVFDLGATEDGAPFIIMELLHGESLAARFHREGRLDPITAARALLPIADALSALHDKRIVHRDVKPDNIFLAEQDGGRVQPKLVDFGIARLREGGRLTTRGTVLGSLDYLSPEQARGDDADHRSDVWAFCVLLYEVLAGRRPFVGPRPGKLFDAIYEHDPTPFTSFGAGDDELWAIVARGLRKSPDQRWQSTRDLGEALAAWLVARGEKDDVCGTSLASSWLRDRPATSLPAGGDVIAPPQQIPSAPPGGALDARPSASRSSRMLTAAAMAALLVTGAAAMRLLMAKPAPPASVTAPVPPSSGR